MTTPQKRHVPIALLALAGVAGTLPPVAAPVSLKPIAAFDLADPDHVRKLEDFPVQKRVHSLAIDPETHRVYAPEQEHDGKPVARMIVYDAVKGG